MNRLHEPDSAILYRALALLNMVALITLLTGRSVLFFGMRQVLVGFAAPALAYGAGSLIGAALTR